MMAVERYLLDELTPEDRDAFEKHLFDCSECALDLRAGAAFVTEAKAQLSHLSSDTPASDASSQPLSRPKAARWWNRWQSAFAVPAFAAMLAFIAFQNISTIPSLRRSASEPRIIPSNAIHAGTRGSAHTPVLADRTGGLALAIALPSASSYTSYSFALNDPSGKQVWSRNLTTSIAASGEDNAVSLVIPGSGLEQGSYTLTISGTTPANDRVEIDRRVLDVTFDH
jgi:hypothetical protein